MTATDQTTALIGVFQDQTQAEHFVNDLRRAGFPNEHIGVLAPDGTNGTTHAGEGMAAGALTGGTVGALAGLAVAGGLIPGIGPVVAGGILGGVLASTATGAAAGGALGGLIGLGIPEDEARHYEAQLRDGRTLVVVQEKLRLPEAMDILRHCK
jgi:hypothetical protein